MNPPTKVQPVWEDDGDDDDDDGDGGDDSFSFQFSKIYFQDKENGVAE